MSPAGKKRILWGVVLLVGVAALVGAPQLFAHGGEEDDRSSVTAAREIVVTMEPNLRFAVPPGQEGVEVLKQEPLVIRIQPGTRVIFRNVSPFVHNVLHATPENLEHVHGKSAFHSPEVMNPGDEFSYVFTEEGTYPILCMAANHHLAGMVATILVGNDPPSAEETFERYGH